MITEQDLKAAIAECQGVAKPNANTCIKLASFLTLYDHMFKNTEKAEVNQTMDHSYSFADNIIKVSGDSEFYRAVNNKDMDAVFSVVNELMETLQVLNPRLYNSVIMKIEEAG